MKIESEIVSSPNTKLPLAGSAPLAMQHVLAMFAGNITVPIIIAGVLGSSPQEKVFLVQAALFVAGIATLIQTIGFGAVGARLPIVQGTSFGFLPICIPVAKAFGLSAVLGAAFVAGLFQLVLGFALRQLRHWFPPIVSGSVVLIIGIILLPVGIRYAAGGVDAQDFGTAVHLFLSMLVLVVTILVHQCASGFLRSAAILIGLLTGYAVAFALGLVNTDVVDNANWISLPSPLKFGMTFPVAAVVGMLLMAIVTTIETVGDISATTIGGANREPSDKELSGGILADGLGTAFASIFNALPNTSYSQNAGLVAFSGVMSRHVVTLSGIILIGFGLFPKLGAIVATIPASVLGGGAIVMFGSIASAGIKLISHDEISQRNMLIVAISLGLGLGLAFVPEALRHLPQWAQVLLKSGILPGAFVAVILNAVLPNSKRTKSSTKNNSR